MAYIEDLPSSGSTSLLKIRSMLQRALPTPLQHTTAVLKPHRVHRMEGVLLCKVLGTGHRYRRRYSPCQWLWPDGQLHLRVPCTSS